METLDDWQNVLSACERMLSKDFNIVHTTLQPELVNTHQHSKGLIDAQHHSKQVICEDENHKHNEHTH